MCILLPLVASHLSTGPNWWLTSLRKCRCQGSECSVKLWLEAQGRDAWSIAWGRRPNRGPSTQTPQPSTDTQFPCSWLPSLVWLGSTCPSPSHRLFIHWTTENWMCRHMATSVRELGFSMDTVPVSTLAIQLHFLSGR